MHAKAGEADRAIRVKMVCFLAAVCSVAVLTFFHPA
jgi:hypothetical protein